MDFSFINDLFKKEVDRKEFLKYLGLILLTICGITSISKTLTKVTYDKPKKGFSSGKYGV